MRLRQRIIGLIGLFLLSAIMVALSPWPLHAQTFYGSIVGTVTDNTGAVVPGATITITNLGTGESRADKTNFSGDYEFVNLVPALYKVDVQAKNFKHDIRERIDVAVDQTTRLNFALQVGAATETVEVTSQAPLLQTDSGTLQTQVQGETVTEMPLNGRNIMNMLELAAGVVPEYDSYGAVALGNSGHTKTQLWSAYSIEGGLTGMNSMYVDGAPINILGSATIGYVPVQDSVQEFNVTTNSADAEYGRYSGGVINMTTKSGSNAWHGSAYEYLRNNKLNANIFFNKRAEYIAAATAGTLNTSNWNKRGEWDQNQYGAVFDGPIKKDKAFFMISYEGFNARTASLQQQTVPTPGMASGLMIMANAAAATTLYNQINAYPGKAGCASIANGGTGVQLNMAASAGCLDPSAAVMKTEWPTSTANYGNGINYSTNSGVGSTTRNITGRIDYTLSQKQRLFGRYVDSRLQDASQEFMPGGVQPGGALWHIGGGATINNSISGVLGDTYTFNPSTVLDVRLSSLRTHSAAVAPTNGMNLAIFGGEWASSAFTNSLTVTNIPALNISDNTCQANGPTANPNCWNPSGFANASGPSTQWYDNETLNASLTKIIGKHSLKFGSEDRFVDRYSLNTGGSGPGAAGVGGTFSFSDTYFTSSAWMNFLLGFPDSGGVGTYKEVGSWNWYQGYYVNDSWQLTRKLTLIGGLRWELPGNIKEKHDRGMVLEPNMADTAANWTSTTGVYTGALGTAVLVNSPVNPDRANEPARHDLLSPHVGFAYRLTNSDVVRGGYGLTLLPNDIQSGLFPDSLSMNSYSDTWTEPNESHLLSNPFPTSDPRWVNGIRQPLGRGTFDMTTFVKGGLSAPVRTKVFPETQQWNLSVSHQFKGNLMVQVGYAGNVQIHLPISQSLNELYPIYWTNQAMPLKNTAANNSGACGSTTSYTIWAANSTTIGQCDRPYPAYTSVTNVTGNIGHNSYHSMPVMLEKRFQSSGVLSATYTWAKALGNAGSGSGGPGGGSTQDWYNLRAEKSVIAMNVSHRLVVSYVLSLPFGKGGKYFTGVSNGVVQHLISGWAVNGITTYQMGFPVSVGVSLPHGSTSIPKTYGTGLRPNYTPGNSGCNGQKFNGTSWVSAAINGTGVLNSACWAVPTSANDYTYNGTTYYTSLGNAPRNDGGVLSQAMANWDFSAVKATKITERTSLEFRFEFFNIFNHTLFSPPSATLGGNGTFGGITSANGYNSQPRLGQAALRLNF